MVGVPVDVKEGGLDALFASSQMPFPAPVATVGIDRGDNGALLAAQIIGIHDEEVRNRISGLRQGFYEKVQRDEYQLLNNIEGNYYTPTILKCQILIKVCFQFLRQRIRIQIHPWLP